MDPPNLGSVIEALAAGQPIVLVDDRTSSGAAALVSAAEAATPHLIAFMVRHTSGFVCVALPENDCDRLRLPLQTDSTDPTAPRFCVTVDAVEGVTTGISAADRARTVSALADPAATECDFGRPGHVVPVRARQRGPLTTAGVGDVVLDLVVLAGTRPAAVFAEMTDTDWDAANQGSELAAFAHEYRLPIATVSDVVMVRQPNDPQLLRTSDTLADSASGKLRIVQYRSVIDGISHVAVLAGEISSDTEVPVYVHTECLPGDVLGLPTCRCRTHLENALMRIEADGNGVVICLGTIEPHCCGQIAATAGVVPHILRDLGVTAR
ncbi:3,4-dihydroxy-2-butanone-4-phosphate synthase [Mycobacterium sp.]|uniref:3,4-dihydroxy-2-butanone-4-phosphate synthase n=1 Tax=Mycobacterium sp. TaxID=1785 RepID=UPI003C78E47B